MSGMNNFFDILDEELKKIIGVSNTKSTIGKVVQGLKDPVVFDHARLNNLQVTIAVLAEDHVEEVGKLTAPISYIAEDGKWTVANLSIDVLNEVFAKELVATDSLPMIIQLYTEDLEKKVNEK